MRPTRPPVPLPWACLITAGGTLSTLAAYWVLLGAVTMAWLYHDILCAVWAIWLTRWFPCTACVCDAVIFTVATYRGPPTLGIRWRAGRLLLAILIVASIPEQVW